MSEEELAFERAFKIPGVGKEGPTCPKILPLPPKKEKVPEKPPEPPDKLTEISNKITEIKDIVVGVSGILDIINLKLGTIFSTQKKKANYHTNYFIDTSDTTRRKLDLYKDMGVSASELIVLSIGGGFDIEIMDEPKYTPAANFQVVDEVIDYVHVTGSGTAGTARIRVGTWR